MSLQFEKVSYAGWANCCRLSNGTIELVVTSDVGPRIIRLGYLKGENEFNEYPESLGLVGGEEWRLYGGHRLWHAPEAKPRSYYPDNDPVTCSFADGSLRVLQPTESTTGIQKELEIALRPSAAHVTVVHRLTNQNIWPVRLAPWALSVMAKGGKAIVPQAPYRPHTECMLPVRRVALWSYTVMSDARWRWSAKYITVQQDPTATTPQKFGVGNEAGWVAYQRKDHLFVKLFAFCPARCYPDLGSAVEVFTNGDMLELETLGPLSDLDPGCSAEHVEEWFLFKGVGETNDDAAIDEHVLTRVESARARV